MDAITIVKQSYQAYVDKDRAALEAVITDDFHFTSPLDNRIDRRTYLERCWPNSKTISAFEYENLVRREPRLVTYLATQDSGRRFKNTEIFTVRDGKIVNVQVFFGWNVPHDAPEGDFVKK